MLKSTRKEAHALISDMFNHALQHMPYDWTMNQIKPSILLWNRHGHLTNGKTIWMYSGINGKYMG